MAFNFNTWVGQVTTAHGVMILGPTLLAVGSGTMTWQVAAPLLVAGTVGLLWPENAPLKTSAQSVVTDVTALIAAYRSGLDHRAATNVSVSVNELEPSATQTRTAAAAAGLALSVAAALTLTACANQTPTQQAAAEHAIASGMVCVADASGKVIATATTSDPNSVKALNAAVATGSALTTDAACQSAIVNGVAALPLSGAASP